jgi:Tfp pilus assembly protein PilF
MSDRMEPNLKQQIDNYLEGKLSAVDARALAQKALDRPDLFDELTESALVKTALDTDLVKRHLNQLPPSAVNPQVRPKLIPFPRTGRVLALVGSVAAALAIVTFYSLTRWQQSQSIKQQEMAREARRNAYETGSGTRQSSVKSPARALKPTLDRAAEAGQPILLAEGLQPGPAPIFRGLEPSNRLPRPQGLILSLDDGLATVDLGSLDGLAKGTELTVFRDDTPSRQVARLIVTTVFRERARARITAAEESIETGNRVQANPTIYFTALLDEGEARTGRGDPITARDLVRKALDWAGARDVPLGQRRKALEVLGALEYQSGAFDPAQQHYESAVSSFGATPAANAFERAATLNNLGSLYLLRGDYERAKVSLNAALKALTQGEAYGRSLNNLGVLAELRGHSQEAEAFYDNARRAFEGDRESTAQDLRAVDKNLARFQKRK